MRALESDVLVGGSPFFLSRLGEAQPPTGPPGPTKQRRSVAPERYLPLPPG
ncbi:unnamed protein product [Tetraodon nigroviridis]|uniref:(spotted green pufferfish) hypothetical protein n=1 Tax=Tetraodon nigroviridis TaxID=99883 RepID=Q4RJF8_TETNG|nr:unnamed protein product [Tetraodon nigroviridis]